MCSRTRENNKNKVGPVIWDTLQILSKGPGWLLDPVVLLQNSKIVLTDFDQEPEAAAGDDDHLHLHHVHQLRVLYRHRPRLARGLQEEEEDGVVPRPGRGRGHGGGHRALGGPAQGGGGGGPRGERSPGRIPVQGLFKIQIDMN